VAKGKGTTHKAAKAQGQKASESDAKDANEPAEPAKAEPPQTPTLANSLAVLVPTSQIAQGSQEDLADMEVLLDRASDLLGKRGRVQSLKNVYELIPTEAKSLGLAENCDLTAFVAKKIPGAKILVTFSVVWKMEKDPYGANIWYATIHTRGVILESGAELWNFALTSGPDTAQPVIAMAGIRSDREARNLAIQSLLEAVVKKIMP
jgi:hypothetical protein